MKKRILVWLVIVCVEGFMLTGCDVHKPVGGDVQDDIDRVLSSDIKSDTTKKAPLYRKKPVTTASLNNMMMPAVEPNFPQQTMPTEPRFDVNAVNLPANAFFASLAKGTKLSILVDPGMQGNITLSLKNVTIEEAIQAACTAYGYQYEEAEYGYHIESKKLITKIFTVNYLDVARNGISTMRVSPATISDRIGTSGSATTGMASGPVPTTNSGTQSAGSDVKTTSNNDFWSDLKTSLDSMIGNKDGHQVVMNPASGLIVIRAYPDELRSVSTYLYSMQHIMARQVILEAQVLEVTLNAEYQSGIQWKLLGLNLDGTQPFDGQLDNPSPMYSLQVNSGGFSNVIELLNTQGRTEVLSSPRISTMNNQKAIIKVGDDAFFVTGVSTTTTANAVNGGVTQDVELTPFFSGIALDVTPEITGNNSVTLHIHPIVSKVTTDNVSFVLGSQQTQNLPLAKSRIRESDSIVHAKNGEVIIIGGLMENDSDTFMGNVPGIDQTPLNNAFGRHEKIARKVELVILLKPVIVDHGDVWKNRLTDSRERFANMRGRFAYTVQPNSGHPIEDDSPPANTIAASRGDSHV